MAYIHAIGSKFQSNFPLPGEGDALLPYALMIDDFGIPPGPIGVSVKHSGFMNFRGINPKVLSTSAIGGGKRVAVNDQGMRAGLRAGETMLAGKE